MRVTLHQPALRELLADVRPFISGRHPAPILNNYLLGHASGTFSVYGTDHTMSCIAGMSAKGTEGRITLPARQLYDIVCSLPAEDVMLDCDEKFATLRCGRSTFKLSGIPASEYPLPVAPMEPAFELPAEVLGKLIDKTLYAASNDELHILHGFYLNADAGRIEAACMSDSRLAYWNQEIAEAKDADGFSFVLPRRFMVELRRHLKRASGKKTGMYRNNNLMAFCIGDVHMSSLVMAGSYPNVFKSVITDKFAATPRMDRASLLAALQRVMIVTDEREVNAVILRFEGNELTIKTRDNEAFGGTDVVACTPVPAPFETYARCPLLIDALKVIETDEVGIGYNEPGMPIFFLSGEEDDPLTTLVMPTRLLEPTPVPEKVSA